MKQINHGNRYYLKSSDNVVEEAVEKHLYSFVRFPNEYSLKLYADNTLGYSVGRYKRKLFERGSKDGLYETILNLATQSLYRELLKVVYIQG